MVVKKKTAIKSAMAFGVAMSAMYVAPELQADVVDLTFVPGSTPASTLGTVSIAEVPLQVQGWDTSTFLASGGYLDVNAAGVIGAVNVSSTLTTGFAGSGSQVTFGAADSGLQYIGFNVAGNVGWFSVDLGAAGIGQGIQFVEGQYDNMGNSIHVGAIPEPSSLVGLAMLALGAVGVRRNRKK